MVEQEQRANGLTSDRYRDEYRPAFVDKWDELIDWERRAAGEDNFFGRLLREHGCRRILDAATGTGYHAVMLKRDGFDVVASDGAEEMIRKTEENAREWNTRFRTVVADWRELSGQIDGEFDAVLCLGNAFTHLFDERDRVQALAEFRRMLKPGGLLVIDQRNYDMFLDHGFKSKHSYYYCGEEVSARPTVIGPEAVEFEYGFPDGASYHLTMYPIRAGRLIELLEQAGFRDLRSFGDFETDYDSSAADFIIHVAATA